ncbi:MAG: hypothetical protein WD691_06545 [Acidimicrobiales bacterium]
MTMVATRLEAENIERFTYRYRLCCSPVRSDIESKALDADNGSTRVVRPSPEGWCSPALA